MEIMQIATTNLQKIHNDTPKTIHSVWMVFKLFVCQAHKQF